MKIFFWNNMVYEGEPPEGLIPEEGIRDALIDGLWWKTYMWIKERIREYGYLGLDDLNDSAVNTNYSRKERQKAKSLQAWIKSIWDAEEAVENQIKEMSDEDLATFDTTAVIQTYPAPPNLPED